MRMIYLAQKYILFCFDFVVVVVVAVAADFFLASCVCGFIQNFHSFRTEQKRAQNHQLIQFDFTYE